MSVSELVSTARRAANAWALEAEAPPSVERRLQRSLTSVAMLRGADALTPGLVEAVARQATIAVAEEGDAHAAELSRGWRTATSPEGEPASSALRTP